MEGQGAGVREEEGGGCEGGAEGEGERVEVWGGEGGGGGVEGGGGGGGAEGVEAC